MSTTLFPRSGTVFRATLLVAFALAAAGCVDAGGDEHEASEVAPHMAQLEHHATKLGLSIVADNPRLAAFYLEELNETLTELGEDVPLHDGIDFESLIEIIMWPLTAKLSTAIELDNGKSWAAYEALVDGCNRCHSSTEHEFIRLAASEVSGLQQVFQDE